MTIYPLQPTAELTHAPARAGARTGAAPSTDAGSLGQGLAALSQPLKLRLSRAPHERQLRDYGANVVLIEPLATMSAVEDFLFPRVYREAPAGESPNTPHGSLGKDKAEVRRLCPCTGWGEAQGSRLCMCGWGLS